MNTYLRARGFGLGRTLPLVALLIASVLPAEASAQANGGEAVSASVASVRSKAPRAIRVGGVVRVEGALRSERKRRVVVLELRSRSAWRVVDRDPTARGGRFETAWRPATVGSYRLRVRPIDARAARRADRVVDVYRSSAASWFGPGLYGRRTACGHTLAPGLVGVAHKSLPCGTRVRFRYGGRSVVAPVIDRGPYAGGREWDLTAATKRALGFPSTGAVLSNH